MENKSTTLKAFHLGWLAHHLFAMFYCHYFVDYNKTTDDRVLQMGEYRLRYLTTWNFLIQALFLGMAVAVDHLPHSHTMLKIQKLKGYIFNTVMAPSTLFVAAMFWLIYFIDRELVYPFECDNVFPSWLNHCTHTNIVGVVLVEYLLGKSALPSFKQALIGLSIFSVAYDLVYLYTFFSAGRWLYGMYYFLNWFERIFFMVFTYAFSVLIMKGGLLLQDYKHRQKSLKVC